MAFLLRAKARLVSVKARLRAGWVDERPHVILHIGPHRTGSTTIQATMNASRGYAPNDLGLITRHDRDYLPFSRTCHGISTRREAENAAATLRRRAQVLVETKITHPVTIISDEDLLGPLPARRKIKGLYPNMTITLPHILMGLWQGGARVTVVWQRREYTDWLESVFHRRNDLDPPIPFDRQQFCRRHRLPDGWGCFEQRLRRACAGAPVVRLSFEDDAAAHMMGRGLFRLAGLSVVAIDNLEHSRPRQGSPRRTTVARFSDA